MSTPCSEQIRISKMEAKLENIEKILIGNGQPGLHDTVIKLNQNVQNLVDGIDKEKRHKRWLITTVVALAGIILGLFLKHI